MHQRRLIVSEVSFLEDAALKKNKGEDDIADPVYKDLNADGDTDDDEVSMNGGWHTVSNLLADEGEAVASCVKIDPLTVS